MTEMSSSSAFSFLPIEICYAEKYLELAERAEKDPRSVKVQECFDAMRDIIAHLPKLDLSSWDTINVTWKKSNSILEKLRNAFKEHSTWRDVHKYEIEDMENACALFLETDNGIMKFKISKDGENLEIPL